MKKLNYFLSLLTCFSLIPTVAAEKEVASPKNTVIAFDMDDVMSIKQKPGFTDFIGLTRIVVKNPRVLLALAHIKELAREGSELGKTMNGAGNIVHAMLSKLADRGYGDFSPYEDEILMRSIKPQPMDAMVTAVKELKRQGYSVIGATNHDWRQHSAYRTKMRAHGVDLNELFDAVVVTRVQTDHDMPETTSWYQPCADENMYAAVDTNAYKPYEAYYSVLKDVAHHVAHQKGVAVDRIIFTDDKKENVIAASDAEITALHFDLLGGSARKTTPEDRQATIATWKQQLGEHGITVA